MFDDIKRRPAGTSLGPVAFAFAFLVLFFLGLPVAHAQPEVVRIVVPFPPGGSTDGLARQFAARMTTPAQKFVVENKAGGNGIIAVQSVLAAPADGGTLFFSSPSSVGANVALLKTLPYDPLKDLEPVARLFRTPAMIVTGGKSPHRTLADLAAASKAREITAAVSAPGQTMQYDWVRRPVGIRSIIVSYKGGAPALQDVAGGMTDIAITDPSSSYSLIQAGMLRPIALINETRDPNLPDVPTVKEAGSRMPPIAQWTGVFVKAGTPHVLIRRYNEQLARIVKEPAIVEYARTNGMAADWGDPVEVSRQQRSDIKNYREMMKSSGIEPQ